MIHRTVLIKLNHRADTAVIQKMQAYVSGIRNEIGGTRTYHFTPNQAAGEKGYNWVLLSVFDDEASMNAYRAAPLHQEFVEYCHPYTDDFFVCFYQAPPSD